MTDTNDPLSAFFAPVSADAPSGDNLEYSADFMALEAALRGTPEVEIGATRTPAVPPEWQVVWERALALSARTRDLRVVMALTRAALNVRGVAGLAQTLALLAHLVAHQWETIHPQLEAEDDFDPTLRINVLSALVEPSQLLREVRTAPLVQVRTLGSFSLRDIEQAREQGRSSDEAAGEIASMAMIDAAFAATSQDDLAVTGAVLEDAVVSVRAIEEQLALHVGVGMSLDLAPLSTVLGQAAGAVAGYVRGPLAEAGDATAVLHHAHPQRPNDGVAGRADVVRMLDLLCSYYIEHEPASPVPLLLQRARRLVDKTFVELLQDLAPDGLGQLSKASGVQHES
jgi:type VI secretion system protein ImpA